jgi:uncharacterized repeat protein (TIGR01451 family)
MINLYRNVSDEWIFVESNETGCGDQPDGYYEFTGLTAGVYKVNETLQDGWLPIGDAEHVFTVVSGFSEKDNNFTNGKLANITIIKDSVPDDPQDFEYTSDLGNFTLDDDDNAALPNVKQFTGLQPGTYYVNETILPDWDLVDIIITGDDDGGSSIDWVNGIVTIDLDPCENITVTFVNSYIVVTQEPGISIVKEGPECVCYGEMITYKITVCNTGLDPLINVNVTDSILGTLLTNANLAVGECIVLHPNYIVPWDRVCNITNTATAEGLGLTSEKKVNDTDDWVVYPRDCGGVGGELEPLNSYNVLYGWLIEVTLIAVAALITKKFGKFFFSWIPR